MEYLTRFIQSKILLFCVVLLLVIKLITSVVFLNFSYNIFFADITETALLDFVNQTRGSLGIQLLTENTKLNQAAQSKAIDMVQKQYFSHISPQGITPWYWFQKIGYSYKYAGENLAIGFFDSREVYDAWMNSPSHKENLLNPNYKEVGTAVVNGFGQNNAVVVVQLFGSQQAIKTTANLKNTIVEAPKIIKEQKEVALVQKPEVLAQAVESYNFFEAPKNNTSSDLYSRFLNLAIYNYDEAIENIAYGFLLIIIGTLLTILFFNLNIPIERKFILRSVVLITLLVVTVLVNKEIIISIIPHQVLI